MAPAALRESAKWIFPIYDYRHPPIKKLLWLFKYNHKKRLAKIFAEILYGRIVEELSELSIMENFREPILIPIPLSRERFRERSYNQTELICEELIRLDTSPRAHQLNLEKNILIKKIDTPHQAQIHDRRHRLKNVVGSFTLKNSDMINGKNIILIDDITTTGATLSEARKVLKKAGAKKIIAFTVAH
jgi:ComF family protein